MDLYFENGVKGGPFDMNLNIDSVVLTLGNPEVGYSDPHLHQPVAEDCTSTFSQFEKRVLYVLILIPKKYSQELMGIVLDH